MTKIDPEVAAVIGERIRFYRKVHQLTQGALAAQVNVTQPALSQWERGVTMPSRPTQFVLADKLQVDRSWLFAELVGRAA